MIIVQIGERVFSMPATELSMWSCAVANKNAGIKMPIIPDKKSFERCFDFTCLLFITANGNKTSPAMVTLRPATSPGEKTSNPRFIKMNEVPQIKARMRSRMIERGEFLFSTIVWRKKINGQRSNDES